MQTRWWSSWLCRIAGVLRTLGWAALLYVVASPWRDLGGWITERLRWFGWFGLYTGVVLGFALGDYMREACPPDSPWGHLRLERRMLYIPALLSAAWLVVLQMLGQRDVASVVFTAFLAYWAGVDEALGAMPLLEGRLHDDGASQRESARESAPAPPWEP